ncbi:MAG: transporter ATP-binding protein [Anaerospora sp.]|nr:transporter ATP-binding protein [Anaerospora sp.]
MLKVNNLHTYYGNIHALKGISFEVKAGEIVTLIGSNGAGKTTAVKTIAGLLPAAEGTVVFDNQDITELADKLEIKQSLEQVLTLFPKLWERRGQQAGTLSGGEQQMLAIGRALMAKPKLLLLDEPSLGLSPILVDTIFGLIVEINRQGIPVLLIEQNARMALLIAARGYIMETGKIVHADKANELLQSDAVRKAYLGE